MASVSIDQHDTRIQPTESRGGSSPTYLKEISIVSYFSINLFKKFDY